MATWPTENANLHFDLSHLDDPGKLTLHVGASEYVLTPHDDASFAAAKESNVALTRVPRKRVTHYAPNVEVPSNVAMMIYVTSPSRRPNWSLETLHLYCVHIPRAVREAGAMNRAHDDEGPRLLRDSHLQFLDATDSSWSPDVEVDLHDLKDAHQTAAALIFHHPEMATQEKVPAEKIIAIISTANGIAFLVQGLLDQSIQHEKDPEMPNWVNEEPSIDPKTRKPCVPPKPQWVWSSATKGWLRGPLMDALKKTKNAKSLEGQCWKAIEGQPNIVIPTSDPPTRPELAADATPAVRWVFRTTPPQFGVVAKHDFPIDATTKRREFIIKNWYLRWLQVSARYYGPGSEGALGPQIPGAHGEMQSQLGYCSSVNTILAIPLPATWTTFLFDIPPNASTIEFSLGGLGLGDTPTWDDDGGGIILTSVLDLLIPSVFLVSGAVIGIGYKEAAAAAVESIIEAVTDLFKTAFSIGFGGSSPTQAILAYVVEFTPALMDSIFKSPKFGIWLAAQITAAEAERAIPVIGWIMTALAIVSDLAALVETTAEIVQCPFTMKIRAEREMDVAISVKPDPDNHGLWPSVATQYDVLVNYRDGTIRKLEGPFDSLKADNELKFLINDQPAGGQLQVKVTLSSDTGWVAAQGQTDWITALPNDGSTLTVPTIQVKQKLVPLTATTTYHFKQKLDESSGTLQWAEPPKVEASTATSSNLDDSDIGQQLGYVGGLNIDEDRTSLGYTWRASDQDIPLAGTDDQPPSYTGQLFALQNISYGPKPGNGRKLSRVGWKVPHSLLYENSKPTEEGRGFALVPDADGKMFYLRRVSLDPNTPFVGDSAQSYGRFYGPQTDIAYHPAGFALGVSDDSKLQAVRLTDQPVKDADAPPSHVYGGAGTRQGLLSKPVAVTVSLDGTVFVLQNGVGGADVPALLAFDVHGNPISHFAGGQAYRAQLKREAHPVNGLDVGVESQGYIYVLKEIRDPSTTQVTVADCYLDIYKPDGSFLAQTRGVAAAQLAVTFFRDVYTLDYDLLRGAKRTQPSLSLWIPSTP